MDFFLYSDENKKKTLIALLAEVKKSDHRNHTNELRFIEDVAHSMGLSEEDVLDIRRGDHHFDVMLPKHEEERMMFFMHVLHLIKIDNHIAPQEETLAKDIGLRLGINPLLVLELLQAYKNEIATGEKLTVDRMTRTIRKYLN